MSPRSFFPGRYFAPRYFPQSSGEAPALPPVCAAAGGSPVTFGRAGGSLVTAATAGTGPATFGRADSGGCCDGC